MDDEKFQRIDQETEVHSVVELAPDVKDILEGLQSMNLNDYSPFEALQELYAIQKKLKTEQELERRSSVLTHVISFFGNKFVNPGGGIQ